MHVNRRASWRHLRDVEEYLMRRYGFTPPIAVLLLCGCAYQVEHEPAYVTEDAPTFVAEAEIVILMHPHDTETVFQGAPATAVGEFTTLTIPIGNIMQEISAEVFRSCFAFGVVFTRELTNDLAFLVAIEPEIRTFSYGYDRVPLETTPDEPPRSLTTPWVEFELAVRAYDASGQTILERSYPSGRVAGETYEVTNRPYERINETFHRALQQAMVQVAEDLRPSLVGQCRITDITAQGL
jgi:hypothetical protein